MTHDAIGLDIGGANIKAATVSGRTWTRPFELWRQPERLADALSHVRSQFDGIRALAVTMTGELCDCFATKHEGVKHILAAVQQAFPLHRIGIWTTTGRFVQREQAEAEPLTIASANWMATATLAARMVPRTTGVLLDTGSTTTDVIPLADGRPVPLGLTDPERLTTGELVYTGVKRTPICALLGDKVAAEWFATTQDVYVRLGLLPEEPATSDTADRRPLTNAYAHARLSRMLCGDPEMIPEETTHALAKEAYAKQRAMIVSALRQVSARMLLPPTTVILAGSGELLARASWGDFIGGARSEVVSLSADMGAAISEAAAAYAVATLFAEL